MRSFTWALPIALVAALPACARQPAASAAAPGVPFTITPIATFDDPWAMAVLPGNRLLVTQKGGALKIVALASARVADVAGAPKPAVGGQGGLGDVIAGPDFAATGDLYLSWVEAGAGQTRGAVVGRGRLECTQPIACRVADLHVIWRQVPKVEGTGHFSHRLALSPDRHFLFVTSGERQKFTPAQDLTVNLGKVLRLTLDGAPAPGNPFAARGEAAAQIWSYGHRNLLGIAFDAQGRLWEQEMGPKGGDEVNLILPGRNYGWPNASNGSHYDGRDIPDHRPGDGYEAPKVWWNPSISPAGLMIYSGKVFPQWRNDAFIGALSGEALIRIHLDGEAASKGDQWPMNARIREVEEAPDGAILLLEDGSGGRLLRLVPPAAAQTRR